MVPQTYLTRPPGERRARVRKRTKKKAGTLRLAPSGVPLNAAAPGGGGAAGADEGSDDDGDGDAAADAEPAAAPPAAAAAAVE